jgi:RNA polymerase sigma-70 factor, ECF subfamily
MDMQIEQAYMALRTDVRQFVARRVRPDAVDDLSQEIFLRMKQHAGELRDETRVVPWLFRIARSVVTDHLRRRRDHSSLDSVDEPVSDEPEVNFNAEMASSFRTLMASMPAEYREALELTEMQGLTQRELAERTGLSFSGAKSRVQRARQMFEEIVRACCDFEVDRRGNVVSCAPKSGAPCKSC